jgi:hypothetical protein
MKRHPIQWFWKALTGFGVGMLVYAQFWATPDIDLFGHVVLSVVTLGWLGMFLFVDLDV